MTGLIDLTADWLCMMAQKVNPTKLLAVQVREKKSVAQRYARLLGSALPNPAEFRSMGVGIYTNLKQIPTKKHIHTGVHIYQGPRGQGGFNRRTHIIATVVQAAASWWDTRSPQKSVRKSF